MFKKAIFALMCLIFTSTTVYAGDIPESLMLGEQQALFIGKLTDMDDKTYTINPLTVMMGSIENNELRVNKFKKYYGNSSIPQKGDFLIVVLLKDNKIDSNWIFKATSYDYRTLKLESEKYNMVKRYEQYINEGKYFEAQKRIDEELVKQDSTAQVSKEISVQIDINEKNKDIDSLKTSHGLQSILLIGSSLAIVILIKNYKSK